MDSTPVTTDGPEAPTFDADALESSEPISGALVDVASPRLAESPLSVGGGAAVTGLPGPPADTLSSLIHEHKSTTPCQCSTCDELSQESEKQGIELLPRRLERYAAAHSRALEMADFLRDQGVRFGHRVSKLQLCGSYLEFHHYFTAPGSPVRLHAAKFCQQDKLCPLCAIRRGAKLLHRYTARVLDQIAAAPSLIPVMFTATVRNGDELSERFNHLATSYTALMKRRKDHLNAGQRWSEAARAWGAVASIEVKRGRNSGRWHPHLHAVWMCESMVDAAALSREWREITGDSHQLDVRPFEFHRAGLAPTAELVASDFAEVFKYSLKFSSMTLADNLHAFERLFGRRLIRAHGTLYGIEAPDDLTDDPLEVEDLPYVRLFFRYAGGHYS